MAALDAVGIRHSGREGTWAEMAVKGVRVAMIAAAVLVATIVRQRAVLVVLLVATRRQPMVPTSQQKPQVQLHRNLPFSASAR